ncbi:NAD(P)H-dependent oxidoreductase [Myroides sp. 1354]|uniref:NAD(P)H-dependent oxidoreductase n=1 Tax=unclassified Myroides TaxID=2642485 RepID=UPI00257553E2|nr:MULTISPECIES: NAD(P)H-dependent oxidoreductase [unclassified Myroides]MDM1043910.1 NAD(P)H-dependent oxidoreductase [Myroides sp. R163-1]MDM1054845.1 NAD(P)H-dependent oxidoreductase [Myroides sp. 1354]MDM1068142.1 NAD(P)H-dependent oxidoreductase [Myroides sp. 1372]
MNILVINGHPNPNSLNATVAQTYIQTAESLGATVRYLAIGELDFNPNLQYGYAQRMELEPDLLRALDDIYWSTHQVWIHPMWWMGMPAVMKGFFDRLFLPGLVFKHHSTTHTEGLLQGKTARILVTMGDLSPEIHQSTYQSSGLIPLQEGILTYCGVQIQQTEVVGPLNDYSPSDIKNLLEQVKQNAQEDIKKYQNQNIYSQNQK